MVKSMKWLGLVLMLVFLTVPAMADQQVASDKVITFVEFISLPGNHGLHANRLLERKYKEYRNGTMPISTLTADNMR